MEHYEMEQVIEQLKRIATALEDANLMNEECIKTNKQWRKENIEHSEQDYFLHRDWIEWQKQAKIQECEQVERWRKEESEKALNYAKERDGQLIRRWMEPSVQLCATDNDNE